ncbi:MAG: GIY-YIG nuclease family protein [Chloroflexota bacterium]
MMKQYFPYIASNTAHPLYVGVTSDLARRVEEPTQGLTPGFTSKHHIGRLVYYESTADVGAALAREKQLKGWSRAKKVDLIEASNPFWLDLSEGWGEG